jgi:hypothetical protein
MDQESTKALPIGPRLQVLELSASALRTLRILRKKNKKQWFPVAVTLM